MQRALGQDRLRTNGDHSNGVHTETTGHTGGSTGLPLELDALVVGAGFAGCYLLYRLRQEGFSAKIIEAGTGLGGIWHWNSYPGARVDSQYPIYQFSLPEVYKDWTWSQEYPDHVELRRYFDHVDKILDIKKDVIFETKVIGAKFDEPTDRWLIDCDTGRKISCRFFLCCTGFAAKRHFPDWPGLEDFQGTICHSSFWPSEGMDVRGKRVAVVGTGATGIQIAQTTARDAAQLTVFQRTPNLCCPMRQASIDPAKAKADIARLPEIFADRNKTYAGFLYEAQKDIKTFDHTREEQEAFLQKLWDMGGFRYANVHAHPGHVMRASSANRDLNGSDS
jgi:cation diffusion facilitator CzcD-associated flavoprotein CzcO